jgi:hypothetical protein
LVTISYTQTAFPSATGGTITDNAGVRTHTFTESGTFTTNCLQIDGSSDASRSMSWGVKIIG